MTIKLAISPFVASLNKTVSEMTGEVPLNDPIERTTGEEHLEHVTVSIKIQSDTEVSATLMLTATTEMAQKITSMIMGMKEDSVTQGMATDTFGELLNMTVGAAQRDSNVKFDFTLPEVMADAEESSPNSLGEGPYNRVVSRFTGKLFSFYVMAPVAA